MRFEEDKALFEDGDVGRDERLALGYPEDEPAPILVDEVAARALTQLHRSMVVRTADKPVRFHYLGIQQAIAGDVQKLYPHLAERRLYEDLPNPAIRQAD